MRVAERLFDGLPVLVEGGILQEEASFLYACVERAKPEIVVEIGMAAGLSSTVVLSALAERAELDAPPLRLHAFDLATTYYADESKQVGYLVDELVPEHKAPLRIHAPGTARDARAILAEQSVDFLFIDGNHRHPWPALDLLLLIPILRDRATVCFHDVNLPFAHPGRNVWGAKRVFDALSADKIYGGRQSMPNIGAFELHNRELLTRQALEALKRYPWETDVASEYLDATGISDLRPKKGVGSSGSKTRQTDSHTAERESATHHVWDKILSRHSRQEAPAYAEHTEARGLNPWCQVP